MYIIAAVDCFDLLKLGYSIKIKPNQHTNDTDVYCDVDTDGGDWSVRIVCV